MMRKEDDCCCKFKKKIDYIFIRNKFLDQTVIAYNIFKVKILFYLEINY